MPDHSSSSFWENLMWWMTLIIAVLAVPAFAFMVIGASQVQGIWQFVTFILSCWLCTYLGMKLMHLPGMSKKIGAQKNDG